MPLFGRRKDKEYQEAARLLSEGQTEEASDRLRELLDKHPNDTNAMVSLAIALIQIQKEPTLDSPNTQEALTLLDRAAELNPRDPVAIFNKGVCQRTLGLLVDALESFEVALEVEDRLPLAILHMAEINYELENWEKADVFQGGCASIGDCATPEDLVARRATDERCRIAFDAMLEGVEKSVLAMHAVVPDPDAILLSGRLTRIPEVRAELARRLILAPVTRVAGLDGVQSVKATAQGYAIVGDGLAGGPFQDLVEWMRIAEAEGTAMDYVYHPKFAGFRDRLVPFRAT